MDHLVLNHVHLGMYGCFIIIFFFFFLFQFFPSEFYFLRNVSGNDYNYGVVYNSNSSSLSSSASFSLCIFSNISSASEFGGLIYFVSGNDSVYNISDCLFEYFVSVGESKVHGGFIHFYNKPKSADV
jgi:hypothetical protein